MTTEEVWRWAYNFRHCSWTPCVLGLQKHISRNQGTRTFPLCEKTTDEHEPLKIQHILQTKGGTSSQVAKDPGGIFFTFQQIFAVSTTMLERKISELPQQW